MAKDEPPTTRSPGPSAPRHGRRVVARRRLGPRYERVDAVPAAVALDAGGLSDADYDFGDGSDTRDAFVAVVAEIRGRGWPVEVEQCWLNGEWVCYPGPARVGVGRSLPIDGPHEIEELLEALAEEPTGPPQVHLSAPQTLRRNGPGEFDTVIAAELGAEVAVDALGAALRSARWAGLAMLSDDALCAVCGDAYPSRHLLSPDRDAPGVCPACVFDGDLLSLDAAWLAYQLDQLLVDDLAAPAGWAAVATMLAALGSDTFSSQLVVAWKDTGLVYLPMPFWDDAGDSWLWVNATEGPLAALRPGTSTGRLAATIASTYPEARRRVEREFRALTGIRLDWELWTAALAYVVSFDTQARDRAGHRGPWHVLESFEAMPDGWEVDGFVVGAAVDCVRKAFNGLLGLAWDDYLRTDDDPQRRGLAAAVAFADLCEANGWEHVVVNDDETDTTQAISVEAMNQLGSHRLHACWIEHDDGRADFAGARLATNFEPGSMKVDVLGEAQRFVELHGHGTDPANHPYVPERDGSKLEWESRRGWSAGPPSA